MASTPSTRRQLDGVAMWSLGVRFSRHGRVLAEKGLGEELSGAPVSLTYRLGLNAAAEYRADARRHRAADDAIS